MSKKVFDEYGAKAGQPVSATVLAGRYASQVAAEKGIVRDVVAKLDLQADDLLFEIGCGPGSLLVPISFLVRGASGLDHPEMIGLINRKFPGVDLNLFGADFIDYPIEKEAYSKILVYSVLHCLESVDQAIFFCRKAFGALKTGGLMLLGDIPNLDMKNRFLGSERGKKFHAQWLAGMAASPEDTASDQNTSVSELGLSRWEPNDSDIDQLVNVLKCDGAQVFVLPQPKTLPFGNTRCDVLVEKL
jgi:cyclopropane fatty-acyl-phospholipid synthase-like methyltransferase